MASAAPVPRAGQMAPNNERTIGKILKQLGFSHVSARPRHPAKDEETVAAFKKRMARPVRKGFVQAQLISLRQRIRPLG